MHFTCDRIGTLLMIGQTPYLWQDSHVTCDRTGTLLVTIQANYLWQDRHLTCDRTGTLVVTGHAIFVWQDRHLNCDRTGTFRVTFYLGAFGWFFSNRKRTIVTYSECGYSCFIYSARCANARHYIVSVCQISPYFFTKCKIIWNKIFIEYKIFISKHLMLLSQSFLDLRTIQRHVIIALNGSSREVPAVQLYLNETLIFCTNFENIFKQPKPWPSARWKQNCSMRSDRHDQAYSHYSQFWERAEIIREKIM